MKKIILTVLVLSFSVTTLQAQFFSKRIRGNGNLVTETRNTANYDIIGVAGFFDVKLVEGKEGKITIHAEENLMAYIVTEVTRNTLKIKWKKGYSISSRKNILITVPFESVSKVSLSGSGDVFTDNAVIKTDNLKVSLSGSGDIKLAIKTGALKVSIAGSGDIDLTGSTTDLTASIAGSGDIVAYDLRAKISDLKISGSGGIKTTTTDSLKVSIAGSGDVYYKGNPKEDIRISGSGSVTSRN